MSKALKPAEKVESVERVHFEAKTAFQATKLSRVGLYRSAGGGDATLVEAGPGGGAGRHAYLVGL